MQKNHIEVIYIRKFTILFLCFFLALTCLPSLSVDAAQEERFVGAVTTQGGALHVRSQPSTAGAVVATLPRGSYITVVSRSGIWWQVEYDLGKLGYCHSDYITPVQGTPARVKTSGNVLNVRSGPGTGYSRVTTIANGQQVLVRSTADGWSRILYNGTKLGYVSSQYLSAAQTFSPVQLALPDFKQTDSRWANYPLGTKGDTIGTIGCVTTGIAMLESYRTGQTVYPHQMAQKLSYSPGGAVYWPNWLTASFTYSLADIYSLLQQGKPVLIGAKTSAGRQHWVVVVGFSGGDTLTADGFTIHDPGSRSRTTLQHFFAAYPYFYKYFYA